MTFDFGAFLSTVEKAAPTVIKTVQALKHKPKAVQAQVIQGIQERGEIRPATQPAGGIPLSYVLIGAAGLVGVVLLVRRK